MLPHTNNRVPVSSVSYLEHKGLSYESFSVYEIPCNTCTQCRTVIHLVYTIDCTIHCIYSYSKATYAQSIHGAPVQHSPQAVCMVKTCMLYKKASAIHHKTHSFYHINV